MTLFAREFMPKLMVQICYILGGTGRSYIVGFGVNPPKRPHHRNSALTYGQSGNWELFNNNQRTNPFTLQGALVGGPSRNVRLWYLMQSLVACRCEQLCGSHFVACDVCVRRPQLTDPQ